MMTLSHTNNVIVLVQSSGSPQVLFTVSPASATSGATYKDADGNVFTLASTIAGATTALMNSSVLASGNAYTFTAGPTYTFTVSPANATAGDVYLDTSSNAYTVVNTIVGGTTLVTQGVTAPVGSPLTKVSGSGDATITYSSFVQSAASASSSPGATYIDAFSNVFTVAATASGATTVTMNGTTTPAFASGRLIKTGGTGDGQIWYTGYSSATSVYLIKASGTGDTVLVFSAQLTAASTLSFTERAHIASVKLVSGSGAASQLDITDAHSGTKVYQANAATSSGQNYDPELCIHCTNSGWTFQLAGADSHAYILLERE